MCVCVCVPRAAAAAIASTQNSSTGMGRSEPASKLAAAASARTWHTLSTTIMASKGAVLQMATQPQSHPHTRLQKGGNEWGEIWRAARVNACVCGAGHVPSRLAFPLGHVDACVDKGMAVTRQLAEISTQSASAMQPHS